jgi:hypothetical protein
LPNMNGPAELPRFSGTFRYEGAFACQPPPGARCRLLLPGLQDCAEIFLNDQLAGAVFCPPYAVDLTGLLRPGENTLRVDAANTLAWRMQDGQSTHMQLAPTGLLAPPVLEVWGG